jgi:hypothetical protein
MLLSSGMKIAVVVGIAGAGLIALLLLLRPAPSAAVPAPAPHPSTSGSARVLPPMPVEAAPVKPAAAALPADPRGLLADLSKALRDNDENAARAILKRLHEMLYPPIPEDQNAALLYQKAFDLAREKMGGLKMKGLDEAVTSAALSGKELTPEQTAALRAWFDHNGAAAAEVTALLRNAATRTQCRFPDELAWQKGVTSLTYACSLLRVSALVEQQSGKTAEAADLALAGLGMARAVRSSPNLAAQFFGCGFDSLTLDALQGTLNPNTPTMAAWLDRADPASVRDAYLRALLGDVDLTVSRVLASPEDPARTSEEELRRQVEAPRALQDLAAYVEAISDFSRLAGRPYCEIRSDLDALVRQHGEFAPWYATLSQDIVPSMPGLTRAIAQSEARMSMAKLSLELERYRERNGGYPASLDALQNPRLQDPFTGQPFAYRKEGEGFVLHTPGDPNGKSALTWRSRN